MGRDGIGPQTGRELDMSDVKVITNNVPRNTIDGWDLTAAERTEFDYIDWRAVEAGDESATFFRYRGRLYDLGEFSASYGITAGTGLPNHLTGWDGYMSDSFFSAVVVRFVGTDMDELVVGTVLS